MKILVTGGAGFIGSNFIRHILSKYPQYEIVNLDKLTYAGNLENLSDLEKNSSHRFVRGDVCDHRLVDELSKEKFDVIINFAAETHVDRSLYDPETFVKTNVLGTQVLLEAVLKHRPQRFIQISTDEVYGSLPAHGSFTEESPLAPNSPYAASKAGADLLIRSYVQTFNLPAIIIRSCNNYGPYQFPEKLIPLFITNAIEDKELPLYGDGLYVRDWIHVDDHCRAIDLVLHEGKTGETYNVSSNTEKTNLEITDAILSNLSKPKSLVKYVKDRPAHDRRYALNSDNIRKELGWEPEVSFEQGMKLTVDWYTKNKKWWQKVKSGEYLKYYEKHYTRREKL